MITSSFRYCYSEKYLNDQKFIASLGQISVGRRSNSTQYIYIPIDHPLPLVQLSNTELQFMAHKILYPHATMYAYRYIYILQKSKTKLFPILCASHSGPAHIPAQSFRRSGDIWQSFMKIRSNYSPSRITPPQRGFN